MCRIASRCQKAGRAGWQKTDVWQSFASFGFEAQLLLDETVCLINIRRYRVGERRYSLRCRLRALGCLRHGIRTRLRLRHNGRLRLGHGETSERCNAPWWLNSTAVIKNETPQERCECGLRDGRCGLEM